MQTQFRLSPGSADLQRRFDACSTSVQIGHPRSTSDLTQIQQRPISDPNLAKFSCSPVSVRGHVSPKLGPRQIPVRFKPEPSQTHARFPPEPIQTESRFASDQSRARWRSRADPLRIRCRFKPGPARLQASGESDSIPHHSRPRPD